MVPANEGSQFSLCFNPEEIEKSIEMKRERLLTMAALALVFVVFVIYGWYRGWK